MADPALLAGRATVFIIMLIKNLNEWAHFRSPKLPLTFCFPYFLAAGSNLSIPLFFAYVYTSPFKETLKHAS